MTTGIILAGGNALRMGGADKAFLKIGRETIIDRQLAVLKRIFKEIIIVTNSPGGRYKDIKGVCIISDLIRERGPMGGIYSGLSASHSFYNFVVACDMPFLNEPLIRYIIEESGGYDAAAPRIDGKFHPVFGVYSKKCIPVIEELIGDNSLRVVSIFSKVKSRFFSKDEMAGFDENIASLININTPDELKRLAR